MIDELIDEKWKSIDSNLTRLKKPDYQTPFLMIRINLVDYEIYKNSFRKLLSF